MFFVQWNYRLWILKFFSGHPPSEDVNSTAEEGFEVCLIVIECYNFNHTRSFLIMQYNSQVKIFEGMGRGVVAKQSILQDAFVLEYKGELISRKEGLKREKAYGDGPSSYMFYFMFRNRQKWWVIDQSTVEVNLSYR